MNVTDELLTLVIRLRGECENMHDSITPKSPETALIDYGYRQALTDMENAAVIHHYAEHPAVG